MEHKWIAEVLEDICEYSRKNGLHTVSKVVKEASIKTQNEINRGANEGDDLTKCQQLLHNTVTDQKNIIWLKI